MRAEDVYVVRAPCRGCISMKTVRVPWLPGVPVLPVTYHGRTEIVNALCRAAFLGHIEREALADFSGDFTDADCETDDS